MDGIILTPLKQISTPKGDVLHAMKKSDPGFSGYGEAYFSQVFKDEIKGWKKHTKMTLNLIVPIGEVEFVIFDEKIAEFRSIKLSRDNYIRLTVSPGYWMAFRGLEDNNLLLNIASIEHDPSEGIVKSLGEIKYDW